jgi:ubiquitin C-terminal hydrolase
MAIVIPIRYNGFEAPSEQRMDREDDESDHSLMMEGSSSSSVARDHHHEKDEDDEMNTSYSTPLLDETSMEHSSFLPENEPENDDVSISHDYVMVPPHHEEEEPRPLDETENVTTENVDMDDLFADFSPEAEEFAPQILPAIVQENSKYGGLYNLGNTCYMASAIQMLASLDGFGRDLSSRVPPSTTEASNAAESNVVDSDEQVADMETEAKATTPLLRDALLDVLDKLSRGETVRPDDFKRCIDERTGLFLGYRQQDSHEFLTTLLDLIDEEYKAKKEEEEKKEDVMESSLSSNEEEEETQEAEEQGDQNEVNDEVDMNDDSLEPIAGESILSMTDDEDRSTLKRPRVEEAPAEEVYKGDTAETNEGEITSTAEDDDVVHVQRSSSFINLNYDDIEKLLYGASCENDDKVVSSKPHENKGEEPKCKLVGGRMNTSQAELTRYDRSQNVNTEVVTTSNQDAAKLETAEETIEDSTEAKSPVDSNFTTEVRVSLTCESCKYRRSHTETYFHLSLEIGSTCCSNVDDCVRKFFAPEKREIKCEKCFHNSAIQTTEITKLPKALLFHLKRFIVDVSPDYTSISYRKDLSSVAFEERIPLESDGNGLFEEFLAPGVSLPKDSYYAIRSVVNHIGSSASCGHYTADAKRPYEGEMGEDVTREWTRFNDSYVSKVSAEEAVANSSHTAYMIMYELESPITA